MSFPLQVFRILLTARKARAVQRSAIVLLGIAVLCGCEQRKYQIATFDSNHFAHEAADVLKTMGISPVHLRSGGPHSGTSLFTTKPYLPYAKAMLGDASSPDSLMNRLEWNDDVSKSIQSSTLIPTRREESARFWSIWREEKLAALRTRFAGESSSVPSTTDISGTRLNVYLQDTGDADACVELHATSMTSPPEAPDPAVIRTIAEVLQGSMPHSPSRFTLKSLEVRMVQSPSLPAYLLRIGDSLVSAKNEKPYLFSGRPSWQYLSIRIVGWIMFGSAALVIGLYLRSAMRYLQLIRRQK